MGGLLRGCMRAVALEVGAWSLADGAKAWYLGGPGPTPLPPYPMGPWTSEWKVQFEGPLSYPGCGHHEEPWASTK